jgi:phytoene dehydrogenase-like protein
LLSTSYDAIFIGAGHNTLAAALHLAAKGWRVAVFEAAPIPGGAVKTGAYTLPGFRHDWGAMNLSLFAGSPFFKAYGAELIRHGLEFVPASNPFATAFPDGTWLGVSTDAAATTARIAALSPEDAETWACLTADFPAEAPHLFGLLNAPMKLRALAYFMFKILRAKGPAGSLDLARFLLASPRQYLTETFRHPNTCAMLATWGMHLDFAPDIAGGALFPYLEGMAAQAFGMVIGKGGADTIITALTSAITARAGTITCNAEVTAITRQNGRATGITLANGQTFTARHVIAAPPPPRLMPPSPGSPMPPAP